MPSSRVLLGSLWMLAGCCAAQAQTHSAVLGAPGTGPSILELTATADGKWIYFTSSQVELKGHPHSQFPDTRLYRFGQDGLTLFSERQQIAPQIESGRIFGPLRPQVSGDGAVVGFTFHGICLQKNCVTSIAAEAEIRGRQTLDLGEGHAPNRAQREMGLGRP